MKFNEEFITKKKKSAGTEMIPQAILQPFYQAFILS